MPTPSPPKRKPPLCSVCDTHHFGKVCPPPNPRIRPKPLKKASCNGKRSWDCIVRWVTGFPGALCPCCHEYAQVVLAAYERRKREQRTSDVLNIQETHYRELARIFGQPVTKLPGEDEFDKWLR